MEQDIIVGLIVALCAALVVWRLVWRLRGGRRGGGGCSTGAHDSGGCNGCALVEHCHTKRK